MADAEFATWVRSVAGAGSLREPVGVLGFDASEPCEKVIHAVGMRSGPTVVVKVSNVEIAAERISRDAAAGYSVMGSTKADIAVAVLSYSDERSENHTGLDARSTVEDLFGVMSLHRGESWSFDVDAGSLEQLAPLREFALTA